MSDKPTGQELFDRGAEEAYLGSILIDGEILDNSDIDPGELYIIKNQYVLQAMRLLHRDKIEVDYLTIIEKLTAMGKLDEIGGPAYVMGLINAAPTSLHYSSYARSIRELSARRAMLHFANQTATAAYDRRRPIEELMSETMARVPQIAHDRKGAQHISIYARRHIDRIEALSRNPNSAAGIPTGMAEYDRLTGGLRKGEELLVMGKPGKGKTMWVLSMAFNLAFAGHAGAVYQMETGEDAVMDRQLSRQTNTLVEHIETGSMTSEEWVLYCNAIDELSNPDLPLYLSFEMGWTTASLRADLTRLKGKHNIEWFALDYLKFLRDRYGNGETERLNYISGELKTICRDLELAGIIIHSMNKAGMTAETPDLESSSQGADIVYDTDKALFITDHVPDPKSNEKPNPNVRTFLFRKSRSKIKGDVFHMEKLQDFPSFVDYPRKKTS